MKRLDIGLDIEIVVMGLMVLFMMGFIFSSVMVRGENENCKLPSYKDDKDPLMRIENEI